MTRLRQRFELLRWLMVGLGIDLLILGFGEVALLATGSYPNVLVMQRENNGYQYYNSYQSHVGPAFVSLLVGIALVGVGMDLSSSRGRVAFEQDSGIEYRAVLFKMPSLWTALGNFIVVFVLVYGFGDPSFLGVRYVHQVFEVTGLFFFGYWWGSLSSIFYVREKASSALVWLMCIGVAILSMVMLGFDTHILVQTLLITSLFPVGYYFNRFFRLRSRKIKTEILE